MMAVAEARPTETRDLPGPSVYVQTEELDRLRKKPWSSGVDAKQQDQKGKGKGKQKIRQAHLCAFPYFPLRVARGLRST